MSFWEWIAVIAIVVSWTMAGICVWVFQDRDRR